MICTGKTARDMKGALTGLSLCAKWPWPHSSENAPEGDSGACKWEIPWLFKPLAALKHVAFERSDNTSASRRDDSETRAFAKALTTAKRNGNKSTILEFYSPKCKLCASLFDVVAKIHADNKQHLSIALANVEDPAWLPEVLHYDIKHVPCFVLLDECGTAVAKTNTPISRLHVLTGLFHLVESLQQSNRKHKQGR